MHELDDRTLAQLAQHGADSDVPRDWVHYIYCGTEDGAAQIAGAAQDAGWIVRRAAAWIGVIASRREPPVNDTTVEQARVFFEGLAANVFGGDCDGWEAEA